MYFIDFRTYFCRSLHGEQPQQTIKNCQKPSEIYITKLHSTHLPFCKTPATATNARTKPPIYKVRGRRCSRRMAHSDPPPPASGQGWNGVLRPLPGSCKSQKSSDSKASPGQPSAADPSLKNHARVLLIVFARRFLDFRSTFFFPKNRLNFGSAQNA